MASLAFVGELMIPRNLTIAIGFMTAFPLLLAMMLSMADVDAALKSQLPCAEVFYQITGSRPLAQFFMAWIILVLFCKPHCSLTVPSKVD